MTRDTLITLIQSMAGDRPVFHSEADFQHALAIALMQQGYKVRLEIPLAYQLAGKDTTCELDLLVKDSEDDTVTVIELKYFKKPFQVTIGNELFDLAGSWGTNLSRFDCWADFRRVGALLNSPDGKRWKINRGFAVSLTNAPEAWTVDTANENTLAKYFSMHQGRVVAANTSLDWHDNPGANSVSPKRLKPYAPIIVPADARCDWYDYSNISAGQPSGNSLFRFLLLEVSVGAVVSFEQPVPKAAIVQEATVEQSAKELPQKPIESGEGASDDAKANQLAEAIRAEHSNRFSAGQAIPPPPPPLSGGSGQYRLRCGQMKQNHPGEYQYHLNQNFVRVDVFYNAGAVPRYEQVFNTIQEENAKAAHDFGRGIKGNGFKGGTTRSIAAKTTEGYNSEEITRAAQMAVDQMMLLWARTQ
jgi:hypothetical protein